MSSAIQNIETLQAIDPNQVSAYLQNKGWHQESSIADKAQIWVLGNQTVAEDVDILLPLNPSFLDFPIRMSQVLETLATIEHRSQSEILDTLTHQQLSDILFIRLNHQDFCEGTIPLKNGVDLLRHAKDLMLSAACSTVEAKKHFERFKPIGANSFVKELQFGQTKRGSFIITIISPLKFLQGNLFSDGEPFTRTVLIKLVHALEATKSIAESVNLNRSDLPNGLIEKGVSANLCEALVGIHKSGKGKGLEIDLNFASHLPVPTNLSTNIVFPPEVMSNVARIGTRLKANVEENVEIIGEVFRLERQRQDETGLVTLKAVNDQQTKIKISMTDSDYSLASEAQQNRKLISCKGNLIKEGQILTLLQIQDLKILPSTFDLRPNTQVRSK